VNRALTAALAINVCAVAFYTSLGPLSSFRSDYLFSATFGVAVVLLAAIAASALVCVLAIVREPPPRRDWAVCAWWIAPLAISSVLGVDPLSGFGVCAMALLAAPVHVSAIRFADRARVAAVVEALLIVGTLAALAGVAMDLTRRPLDLWVFNHGRAAGPFATANYFGAFLVTLILIAVGGAIAWTGRRRAVAFAALAAGSVALVLTFSRSAQFGTVAAVALLLWWLGRKRAAGAAAALLALAAVAALARPDVHHDPSENFSRPAIWRTGLRVASLFPLTGAGPMGYHTVYPVAAPVIADPAAAQGYVQPHNVVISLAADLGIAGLAAVAAGWVLFARRIRRSLERCDREYRVLSLAICAGLAGTLAQGMFDLVGVPELVFVWMPLAGLAAAAARAGGR
jgi:hypothetical protein